MNEGLGAPNYIVMHERTDASSESTAVAREEIAATRERISDTIADIEQRMSDTVASAKEKVDVVGLIKQHPWPALTLAFAAGLALSATGADRRAATATKEAAKRAPDAAKRGAIEAARAAAAGASQLASAAVDRVKGAPDATDESEKESGGLIAKLTGPLRAQARELGEEVQRGADELTDAARRKA